MRKLLVKLYPKWWRELAVRYGLAENILWAPVGLARAALLLLAVGPWLALGIGLLVRRYRSRVATEPLP